MSLSRIARLMQEGALYGLLFLLPFSKAAIEIAFGVLCVGWALERLHPATRRETVWREPALRPLLAAAAIFLSACALSVLASADPALSLRGFTRKWLEYLTLFVIVTDVVSRPGVARRSLGVLAVSAIAVVFEGITQERYGQGFFRGYRLDFFRRMTGPYENPIDLATYLMVILPPLMAYAFLRPRATRWRIWGLFAVLIACLARTSSLGAWLGLGVGLAVISRWRTALRRHALIMLAVGVVAGGAFLIGTGRLPYAFSMSYIGKSDRLAMWQAAIGMIGDRPVLGHGINTFMANYLDYWVGGERQPRYAHNCYLQMAAEAGLVGFAAFAWLLWSLVAHLVQGIRRLGREGHPLPLGLLGGLVAFLAQAGIDTNFYALRQAVLFWTLAGIAVGWRNGCELPRMPDVSDSTSRVLAEPAVAPAVSSSHG